MAFGHIGSLRSSSLTNTTPFPVVALWVLLTRLAALTAPQLQPRSLSLSLSKSYAYGLSDLCPRRLEAMFQGREPPGSGTNIPIPGIRQAVLQGSPSGKRAPNRLASRGSLPGLTTGAARRLSLMITSSTSRRTRLGSWERKASASGLGSRSCR